MKRERSSEESESGNGRSGASGGTAPDSSQGAVPGSIGAPSAPGPRTETEGGDAAVAGDTVGGLARTPTSSASGPEETGEPEAQAPAVAHAAGVSIGRTTSGPEGQPGGEEAAVAPEAAAPVAGTASAATTTVAVATAGAAGVGPAASVGGAEGTAGTSTSPSAASEETASAEAGRTATASAAPAPAASASAEAVAEATADTSTSGATSAATATVATAASSTPPGSASATEGGAPERPGRVSRPMVVAAAFAGALLLGAPFVVAGVQKDEPEPQRREAAAAWKEADQDGGYVPGTDPDSPQGAGTVDGDKPGSTPARGGKGPVNHVRADVGDGPTPADVKDGRKPANGSAETGAKDGKGAAEGTGGTTEKGDAVARTPVGTGATTPAATPSAGSVPKSTPTVVYSGVSGPECPTQRFQKSGYYSDGKAGWATHSGGFGGYGCAGKYLSMPMSGSSSKDSGGSATWLFDLPDNARKCSISVHVPGSSDIVRVGGNPSYYTVYDRFLPRSSNLVGSYYVNQQTRRGTWYNVPGTFAVDAMKLSVRLHDRGQDSDNEHHAISALKVTCTN